MRSYSDLFDRCRNSFQHQNFVIYQNTTNVVLSPVHVLRILAQCNAVEPKTNLESDEFDLTPFKNRYTLYCKYNMAVYLTQLGHSK